MGLKNYHTHTHLCKHAKGTVSDFCRAALEQGIDVLGITDHTPHADGRWNDVRMEMEQLPLYLEEIEEARKGFPQLTILAGMECEYDESLMGFYRDTIVAGDRLPLIACAIHHYKLDGVWQNSFADSGMDRRALHAFTDYTIAAIQSGFYSFIAHPDLLGIVYRTWDEETDACSRAIIQAAVDMDIPLEINANGFRKRLIEVNGEKRHPYPWRPFWELVCEYGGKVLTNSDAHRPEEVWGNTWECVEFAESIGLNVINDTFYLNYVPAGR